MRPTHVRNSGLIFDWAKPPPETGPPGQDVLCRCSAIPIVTQATRRRLGRSWGAFHPRAGRLNPYEQCAAKSSGCGYQ